MVKVAEKHEQAWRRLASEIGAEFVEDVSAGAVGVAVKVNQWTVTLRGSPYGGGRILFISMKAPYMTKDGFRVAVRRSGPLSKLACALFRTKDVQAEYPGFDRDFVVRGNDKSKVRALLANSRIRELIQSVPSVDFQIVQARKGKDFVEGVQVVYLNVDWGLKITDVERIKSLFELFAETLNHLCRIGSASEGEPIFEEHLRVVTFARTGEERAWRQLSGEIGGKFIADESGQEMTVAAKAKQWTIVARTFTLTTYRAGTTRGVRMTAAYMSRDGFRFRVLRKGRFARLRRKLFGNKDIEVGYPEFDRDFIIQGNDESKVRALLANPRIRELIRFQPSVHFEVVQTKADRSLPKGVQALYYPMDRVITDVDQLKSLFELFEETLNQLCQIGSASEDKPDFKSIPVG